MYRHHKHSLRRGILLLLRRPGFNYLQNETIYYDFDRQSGVQYNDWVRDTSSRSTPKKIKVSDYNHFRNWYTKMTANGKFPGIISNMYFMKDGKRHAINPPKPRLDEGWKSY